jgi:molybdopterin converting factor small subunit
MQVRVIPFGVLKDWLGAAPATIELREGASVADLLAGLGERSPAPPLRGIAVSVNAEYATAAQVLHEGDEVGLLPPSPAAVLRGRVLRARRTLWMRVQAGWRKLH